MSTGVATAAMQAEQLKQDGNLYFQKNRLGAAIDAYTEAITLCPDVAIYWTNRALCHRKRNDWARVEEDSRKAIHLDHSSVKGHYMLGLALIQKENYAEGIKELEKSMDLGRGANPHGYMIEEIWQELATAKYQEWDRDSTKRSWDLKILKESSEIALKEKHSRNVEDFTDEITDSTSEQIEAVNEVFSKASEQIEAVNVVFSKAAEFDTPTEIPDHLCCRITLDIFRDPVIAPSGFTYERATILGHLEKVGNFDPITRQPLYPWQLVQNLAIKEAVQSFLEKYGWAYKMD